MAGKGKEEKCLTLLNVNARRILNKSGAFEHLIDAYNADVVRLTERILNGTICSHELFPPKFSAFKKDVEKQRGGGVAILVKNSFSYVPMSDVTGAEAIFGKFRCTHTEYVLGSVYRPPEALPSVTDSLGAYLRKSESRGQDGSCQ